MSSSIHMQHDNHHDLLQLVSFQLGDEEFGVDILRVQEINRMLDITRLPDAPSYVEGVINLRGSVVPIVDLRKRFGLPQKENDKNTRIIVVEIFGKIIGFVVDGVNEVLRIPANITEAPPSLVGSSDQHYITGVGKLDDRLLLLLDLEKVLVN
jgi:purine-binding chemotaxis protein CheW